MRTWTKQQTDAIEARRGTVLVSAAAGSGKTSVLVERIIKRLTDPVNPTSADRLVVVTYTNAAAAEMKERVEKAILAEIQKNPENRALRKQQMLIPSMNISTVHSFCSKLIREYFHVLDIAPDYKIAADKQREELMAEALDEVIGERLYREDYLLADVFSSERDDKKLKEMVLRLYEFTSSHLFPHEWLNSKLSLYTLSNVEDTPWAVVLFKRLKGVLDFSQRLINHNMKAVREDEKLSEKFTPMLADDLALIERLQGDSQNGDWDEISEGLKSAAFGRMPTVKGYADDSLKNRIAKSRDSIKESIGEMKQLFWDGKGDCQRAIEETLPLVKALSEITKDFTISFNQKKKERKLADYGDLEHCAIKLLVDENGGNPRPSDIAREISQRFDEIMVDEYQDTNEVQDWIFRAISKNDENKFMVGDVKQCIYSFRQAMPHIFIGYKDEFTPYKSEDDIYPGTVVLDKNYRSRPEVINSVNFVFSTLMSREVGGIDYTAHEALTVGAQYTKSTGNETRLDFIEKSRDEDKDTAEINHIGNIIKEMMDSGFKVEREGELVNASYGDFCILLRSANKYAGLYAQELKSMGIPAAASTGSGFFKTREVSGVLSFLQVIDNPNQDIPLFSVLMGPVYGFCADDLAELRIKDRKSSIYTAVQKEERFKAFLEDLEELRLMAVHLPADRFIDYFYSKTGYMDLVLAMEKGESRLNNLHKLRQYAGEFESAGYIGLSGFVRFTGRLKKNNSDLEGAQDTKESDDLVRIMSIHKSKGLEFPVCIVAGCGRGTSNDTSDVVLSSSLGMGLRLKDKDTGATYTNIIRDAVLLDNKAETMSEELRVLYVAMTRAREKLIMVSTVDNIDTALTKLGSCITGESKVDSHTVGTAPNMASWLLLCALKHRDGRLLRDRISLDHSAVCDDNYTPWQINIIADRKREEAKQPEVKAAAPNMDLYNSVKEKIDFVYLGAQLNLIPAKVTASAVAQKSSGRLQSLPRPGFLSARGLTPAERGIALHSFMQYADFKKASLDPQSECSRLVKEGFITAAQGAAVNMERVKGFLKSDLGIRMAKSRSVFKELRFTAEIPASLIDAEFPRDTGVILQGAVDCAFTEGDKLFIVDFKTDRMDDPLELEKAYGIQLKLYARALAQVKEAQIGGCSLYSLYLNEEIKIDMQGTD